MIGRLADLFRLAWGLIYWNTRKSWFRWRRGRSPCPCQSPSDSGKALETHCDACLSWHKPAHFRRVCPLLVDTPDGLRCSANTADVRPFWGRTGAWYGGTALALYLAGALAIFAFLRTVGYPISIVHLVWPGKWHRVGQVRGWFFLNRSQEAFAAGRPAEGMLYLANAYDFTPDDYGVAFSFAQKLQLRNPLRSDVLYRDLLVKHPEQRNLTAQTWFRALLGRGDFPAIEALSAEQLVADPGHAAVWLRALIFAGRQSHSTERLQQLLEASQPEIAAWRPLLLIESQLRANRLGEALRELRQPWAQAPAYGLYYQISELINHGEGLLAVDLLGTYQRRLDDTARATLLLDAYGALGANQTRERLVESLLNPPFNPQTASLIAANLIRHPNAAILDRLFTKFSQEKPPLTDANLETYVALFCAAGAGGDWHKLHLVASVLRRDRNKGLSGNIGTLAIAEAFFRGQTPQTRIAGLLPALPASLEVHYALLERYPGAKTGAPELPGAATKP